MVVCDLQLHGLAGKCEINVFSTVVRTGAFCIVQYLRPLPDRDIYWEAFWCFVLVNV